MLVKIFFKKYFQWGRCKYTGGFLLRKERLKDFRYIIYFFLACVKFPKIYCLLYTLFFLCIRMQELRWCKAQLETISAAPPTRTWSMFLFEAVFFVDYSEQILRCSLIKLLFNSTALQKFKYSVKKNEKKHYELFKNSEKEVKSLLLFWKPWIFS